MKSRIHLINKVMHFYLRGITLWKRMKDVGSNQWNGLIHACYNRQSYPKPLKNHINIIFYNIRLNRFIIMHHLKDEIFHILSSSTCPFFLKLLAFYRVKILHSNLRYINVQHEYIQPKMYSKIKLECSVLNF